MSVKRTAAARRLDGGLHGGQHRRGVRLRRGVRALSHPLWARYVAPMAAAKSTPAHPVKVVSKRDAPLVDRLRKICLALPQANERVSHGEPTWFAGKGKVFAMLDNHHHASNHLGVWLPLPRGVQQTLIETDPERFFSPPYVGVRGWVGVVLDTNPDWAMVTQLIRDAFVHVATKSLIAQLEQ